MAQVNDNDNVRLHYETLVRLFSLGSQEFYNRFTAMVLTHSILLSGLIVGTDIFKEPSLDRVTKLATAIIAIIGVFLCIVWKLLLRQSLAAQNFYRNEAMKLERDFQIFTSPERQTLSTGFQSVRVLSWLVIGLFIFLYLVLLLFIIIV